MKRCIWNEAAVAQWLFATAIIGMCVPFTMMLVEAFKHLF